jgi:anti-sigma regulatory factor (Ser/Thr protein kinase)
VSTPHVDDFVVAVNEVVNNAVTHGRPPVEMRLWVTDEEWTCHVIDRGEGFHDPLAGYPAAAQSSLDSPLGLVLVRQLCDELAMRRTREGFVVRLTSLRRATG